MIDLTHKNLQPSADLVVLAPSYDSDNLSRILLVVFYLRECNLNVCLGFQLNHESDNNEMFNVSILMTCKTGESQGFLVSFNSISVARLLGILKVLIAILQSARSLPAPTVLALIIALLSVEKVSAQITNGNFSSGGTGWTTTAPADSSLSYAGNQLTVVSDNNGGSNSRTYASQSLTNTDPGFLTWLLRSYTSVDADLGPYDYPMVLIGTTFSYVNTGGGIQATNTGAAVDNDNTGITNLTVRTILTAGTRIIGQGVTSTDSCCGAGTAIWDDVEFQQLTQSPGAQTTPFNTALTMSGVNAPRVATNSGAATMTVTLSVTNGVLNLGSTAGITITAGANGTSTMTFTGSPANINNALNNLVYTPTSGFSGGSTLTFFANGGGTSDTDTIGITVSPPTFSFTLTKTTPTANVTAAGTVITYTVTATNTGTGSLTGLTISDAVVQGASSTTLTPGAPAGDGGVSGTMEAGEIWVYTITHTVTQAQMDNAGNLVNTATFDTAQTVPQSASATTTITANPSLSVVKSSSASGFITDNILEAPAGTVVTYTYTVTNNGNQTIGNIDIDDSSHTGVAGLAVPTHAVSAIDNGLPGGSSDGNADPAIWGQLGPQDVIVFSTTYTIDQGDIDAQ